MKLPHPIIRVFTEHNWRKLGAAAGVVAVFIVALAVNRPAHGATATVVPVSDVSVTWTPSTGTTHYTLLNDGATSGSGTPVTTDYIHTGTGNSTVNTDELGLQSVTVGTATQMVIYVYAMSATNANGGTLDALSINLNVNGTLQTAGSCTPAFNTWGWCSVTFTGTWSQTQVNAMHAVISDTINGSGNPNNRKDDLEVATVTGVLTYNNAPGQTVLTTPASGATAVSTSPQFTFRAPDPDNDYLLYKVLIYQSDCTTAVATADQTASQTGWSGQDQQTGTAYTGNATITSSTMATYSYQGQLSPGTTYCWQAQAIDPGGSNTWGTLSAAQSFTTNNAPAAPTLSTPGSGATGVALTPQFTLRTTDAEGDYLRYKILLFQSDCSTSVATADQTASQTGWSGQDQQAGTAYTGSSTIASSTMATYTYQGTLNPGTTYCWQAQAVDPGGSNTFSMASATQSFTTNAAPAAPTLSTPASGATGVATSPQFTLRTTDANNDYLRYKIIIYQSDCSTIVTTADQTSSQTGWSGQDQQGGTAYTGSSVITSSTMATYTYAGTLYANTTYCWAAQAIDPGGSNTWSALTATRSFTTGAGPTMVNIRGGTVIRGGSKIGN